MEVLKAGQEFSKKVIDALNYSATPYHVVDLTRRKLEAVGFKEIKESYKILAHV